MSEIQGNNEYNSDRKNDTNISEDDMVAYSCQYEERRKKCIQAEREDPESNDDAENILLAFNDTQSEYKNTTNNINLCLETGSEQEIKQPFKNKETGEYEDVLFQVCKDKTVQFKYYNSEGIIKLKSHTPEVWSIECFKGGKFPAIHIDCSTLSHCVDKAMEFCIKHLGEFDVEKELDW